MRKVIWTILFILYHGSFLAQQSRTVGLLNYDKEKSFDGLNLLFPRGAGHVYLINNCGEVVHTWVDSSAIVPNQAAYLQPDGSIFIAKGNEPGDTINFEIGNERIEHRDWDNNLLWSYSVSDSHHKAHHDFKVLPNGNILVIAWELIPYEEAIAAGRNPALIPRHRMLSDQIVEIKPIGKTGGEVVWKWRAWDHLVQNFDSTKINFGVVEEHAELININYKTYSTKDDWLHINAIDFNQKLNLILLSVPAFNEIWIIDHSTSTGQAALHIGGKNRVGGDLWWRWGNPEAYGKGDSSGKKLFFQHNAHWLKNELEDNENRNQNILLFNNFFPDSASSVSMLAPVLDKKNFSHGKTNYRFLPDSFLWSYTTPEKGKMFSPVASGVQLLPNGNKLICVGKQGYLFEIDSMQRVVWEYVVPTKFGVPVAQGTKLAQSDNRIFKVERYPMNFPGFRGKDLSGKEPLELMTDTAFCHALHNFEVDGKRESVYIYWNKNAQRITLLPLGNWVSPLVFVLKDSAGSIVSNLSVIGKTEIKTKEWRTGVYHLYFSHILIRSFYNF